MTRPAPFQRLSSPVEALHVRTTRDAHVAYEWLHAHGVEAALRVGFRQGALHATARDGGLMPISLGQHLVLCQTTGEFTTWDDRHFRLLHGPRPADDLEAIMEALR